MADNGPLSLGGLTITDLGKRVWSEMTDDNVWDAAAQLGYYFMLALFPLLIFVLSLVGVLGIDVKTPLMQTLQGVMPGQAYELLGNEINRILAGSNGGLLTFGMLGTVWAASSGVASLVGTLNRAYDVEETRGWLKVRGVAIGLTFALVILIVAGAVLLIMGDEISSWVVSLLGLGSVATVIGTGVNYVLGLALMFIGLEVIYYLGPDVKDQKWVWISPGAIAAVVLFVLSSVGFSLYVRFSDSYSATYGSLGAVIILMLWLYLLGLSIVMGGEINAEIAHAADEGGRADAPDVGDQAPNPAPESERAQQAASKPGSKPEAKPARQPAPAAPQPPPPPPPLSETGTTEDLVNRDLLAALDHPNSHVREGALMSLATREPTDAKVLERVRALLEDPSPEVRSAASRVLDRAPRRVA